VQPSLLEFPIGDTSDVGNKERFDSLDAKAADVETRLADVEISLGIRPARKTLGNAIWEFIKRHKKNNYFNDWFDIDCSGLVRTNLV
jgi:hypothetical protein